MIELFNNANRTYYITFVNSAGEEFNITPPNYLLTNFSGFEQPQSDIQLSKAPYQDGRSFIDDRFSEKYITLEFAIMGETQQDVFDRRLTVNQKFNTRLGIGYLKLEQVAGSTYYIDVITKSIKFAGSANQKHNICVIELIAPNPFWYDPNILTSYLVGFSGGFSFPMSFPINFGTVGTQININNTGNVDTPLLITFSGEIVDPIITNNTTGEALTIVKTIADGDTLVINTAFGSKSVRILSGGVYTNAFEYVDPDSVFFQLVPGINSISYSATSEGSNAKGQIQYYLRYSGV